MNLAAIFAMLMHAGVCAPVEFSAQDGSSLTVLVCPILKNAPAIGDDRQGQPAPPPSPVRKPLQGEA